jgi:hypothetical protein
MAVFLLSMINSELAKAKIKVFPFGNGVKYQEIKELCTEPLQEQNDQLHDLHTFIQITVKALFQ